MWLFAPLAFATGAVIGSFLVTAAVRAARSEQVMVGRSHCDACHVELGFLATVPLVSFALARGRCRICDAGIGAVHPVGELAGGSLVLAAVLIGDAIRSPLLISLGLVLIAAAAIDATTRRLPDALTAAAALICALLALATSEQSLLSGIVAAALTFVTLQGLRRLARRRHGEPGLGFGDVKLLTALALWLGALTPWVAAAAAGLGLCAMGMLRPADGRLAFGPAICIAALGLGFLREAHLWLT